jgi:hypothetical protein
VVSQGETTTVNAQLARGAGISGRTWDAAQVTRLPEICVNVFDESFIWHGVTVSNDDGEYSVGVAANRTYLVTFNDCSEDGLRMPEWWHNRLDFLSADDLETGFPGTVVVGIDASLALTSLGDAGCDGDVNAIDAAFILQFVAGFIPGILCENPADVNADGVVDALDASLILQYTADLIDEF